MIRQKTSRKSRTTSAHELEPKKMGIWLQGWTKHNTDF